MEHDCDVEELKKSSNFVQKIRKMLPGGTPREAKKIGFAAKMARDASKSGFEEALEAPWGRLGRPKREPSWSKIEAGRVFF